MHLLLIADTHIPKRARDLPEPVWREVDRADVVVHAGDWVDASPRRAGAAQPSPGRGARQQRPRRAPQRLPEVARVELDGLKLGVVHETGRRRDGSNAARGVPRPRRPRLRAQSHPLGHHHGHGPAVAEPGSPPTVVDNQGHLPDGHRGHARLHDVRLHEAVSAEPDQRKGAKRVPRHEALPRVRRRGGAAASRGRERNPSSRTAPSTSGYAPTPSARRRVPTPAPGVSRHPRPPTVGY